MAAPPSTDRSPPGGTSPTEGAQSHIGQPLRRKEDDRLLRGKGRFSDDFSRPGQAHAAMVRSPHPHARIVAIEGDAARAMPGVLGLFTGSDVSADGLAAIPHNPVPSNRYDLKLCAPGGGPIFVGPHALLPADRTRHVGEAVAMVVAETGARLGARKSRSPSSGSSTWPHSRPASIGSCYAAAT